MKSPSRKHSRPYSGSLSPRVVAIVAVLAGLILAFVLRSHRSAVPTTPAAKNTASMSRPTPSVSNSQRKVFPLSVIRGGAYSAEELARARRTDPVVAVHYADFSGAPRFQKLGKSELMYVSYRRGNQVYWSRQPHAIDQGETVISDGNCLARARCGNRLSATPRTPVASVEPPEEVLNTPEIPDDPAIANLVDLPGPAGRTFDMGLPAAFGETGGAAPITVAGGGAGKAGTSGPSNLPASYYGPAAGGAGPVSAGALPRTANAVPATVVAPTGLPVTTTSGSNLPTSSNFPGTTSFPAAPPVVLGGDLAPEPATFSYCLLATGLVLLGLSRRRRIS